MVNYGLAFVDTIDNELNALISAIPPKCVAEQRPGAWWAYQYKHGECLVFKTPYEMVRLSQIRDIVINEATSDTLAIIAYALCAGKAVYYLGELTVPKSIWQLAGRFGVDFSFGDVAGLAKWLTL